MTTATNRYLDAIKARLGIPSDNKLAAYFGMTHQRICEWRRGATSFSDDRCIEVARILEIPAEQVLFEIQAERARKAGKSAISDLLEDVFRRLRATPAALAYLAIFTGLSMPPSSADAADFRCSSIQHLAHRNNYNFVIIDIMSTWLRRICGRFQCPLAHRLGYVK